MASLHDEMQLRQLRILDKQLEKAEHEAAEAKLRLERAQYVNKLIEKLGADVELPKVNLGKGGSA